MKHGEKSVHQHICNYIKLQYPNIVFTSDASGLRVGMGIRMELKRKRSKHKIPDLIILHPSNGYHGLCIEVKTKLSDVFKKDGSMKKNEHTEEQSLTLEVLNKAGYHAVFGCGFVHCRSIIDNYLTKK